VAQAALAPGADVAALKEDLAEFVTGAEPAERHQGIPFPGTFVVDADGRVTARFFEDSYRERTTIANVMVRVGVGAAPVGGLRASTDHLEVTTYPSDAQVSRANHFSLVLDVTPRPGMHVYAPGAEGYRVISLKVAPQTFLRPLSLTYPEPEIYHFQPLDERVRVYQKPFTLLQEVVLDNQPEGEDSLRVDGTLEYQACDDKICYNPVSVPLSWTLRFRPRVGALAPAAR
jgi:DsbC/DsbD-like thiol-disulfide interchange protein